VSSQTVALNHKRRVLGAWGEEQACQFLVRQGFSVVERNFHAPMGELDIIARKGDDWYFIEVKTRQRGALANDLAITQSKRHKLEKTVRHYCFKRSLTEGSFILAGLVVEVDKPTKNVAFRLAVFC
jgi:putative endonuclease